MSGNASDGADGAASGSGPRVAFFGGSFDPPHLGHLAVARAARSAFRLDEVLFAPVGVQPLKPDGPAADFADRVAMTSLAIAGERGFAISLADAPKPDGEPNFSLQTLRKIRDDLGPDSVLYCLMGADSFLSLRRWHGAAEVPFMAPMIVASRPGEPMQEFEAALPQGLSLRPEPDAQTVGADVEVRSFRIAAPSGQTALFFLLPGLHVDVSASEIRRQLRAGSGIATANSPSPLPDSVAEYIKAHRLYR
jgi:nicotinate-nucleotide adenylyltransferase